MAGSVLPRRSELRKARDFLLRRRLGPEPCERSLLVFAGLRRSELVREYAEDQVLGHHSGGRPVK